MPNFVLPLDKTINLLQFSLYRDSHSLCRLTKRLGSALSFAMVYIGSRNVRGQPASHRIGRWRIQEPGGSGFPLYQKKKTPFLHHASQRAWQCCVNREWAGRRLPATDESIFRDRSRHANHSTLRDGVGLWG